MSYLRDIAIRYADSVSVDSFGRGRTSSPFTILDLKQVRNGLPLFYDDQQVSGSGTTSTYNTDQASTTLRVASNTAGMRVKQSKLRGVYQPGKSFLVFLTGVFGGNTSVGNTKRMGYFDARNGLFFQCKDGVFSVARRTSTSGSPIDNVFEQSTWNIDKMDGTGPSGITLDFSKTEIFIIDFEWLGVGRVRFAVNVDGKTYPIHELNHANNLDVVYMGNPNLPIRYEISNDGNGLEDSLVSICASVISEGGNEDVAASTFMGRGNSPHTLGAQGVYTPILSVRLKSDAVGLKSNPLFVDVLATTNYTYEWRLLLNPTFAGVDTASWTEPHPHSALEYDISRTNLNTITGGYPLAGGYGSSTSQSRSNINAAIKSYLTLGTFIDGTSDQLVLAATNISGAGGSIVGGLTIGEYL